MDSEGGGDGNAGFGEGDGAGAVDGAGGKVLIGFCNCADTSDIVIKSMNTANTDNKRLFFIIKAPFA